MEMQRSQPDVVRIADTRGDNFCDGSPLRCELGRWRMLVSPRIVRLVGLLFTWAPAPELEHALHRLADIGLQCEFWKARSEPTRRQDGLAVEVICHAPIDDRLDFLDSAPVAVD